MKNSTLLAAAIMPLALAACGGGTTEDPRPPVTLLPSPQPTPAPSGPYTGPLDLNSLQFVRQPEAFLGQLPFDTTGTTSHAVLDVNSDGFLDIVFAFWTGVGPAEWGQNVGDRETPNRLAVFINQQGRQFADMTQIYVSGGTDLGGATRKAEPVDINRDGKIDLVFAVNREDGRSGSPLEFNTSQSSALISQGDFYRIFRFGDRDWHHNVVTGQFNSRPFVVTAGFAGSSAAYTGYSFEEGQFFRAFSLPFQVSANTARFFSDDVSGDSNILVQTQNYPNLLGVELWVKNNGLWQKSGQVDNPFQYVKDVRFVSYNGDDKSFVPVYKVEDQYILGGGGFAITESRFVKLNDDGPIVFAVKMETPIIPNFSINSTEFIRQDILIHQNRIIFYEFNQNSIVKKNITVNGEIREVNYNFMSVQDINRDGLQDIIVHPYSLSGSPIIYQNTGQNSFSYQPLNDQNFFRYNRDTATPIIADFNNDGIFDIVTIPANGNDQRNGRSMVDFIYYIGSRT